MSSFRDPIRRINLFGGPGVGKSITAAHVYHTVSIAGYDIQLVQEYVKSWAYEKRAISSYDQFYLFAKQLRKQDLLLKNDVALVVTDSPLHMSVCYSKKHPFPGCEHIHYLAKYFDEQYGSLNFFLSREGMEYKQNGRYENEAEAIDIDIMILEYLDANNIPYHKIESYNAKNVAGKVFSALEYQRETLDKEKPLSCL